MQLNLKTNSQGEELVKAYLEENASEVLADKINNGVAIEKDGKTVVNKKDSTRLCQIRNRTSKTTKC